MAILDNAVWINGSTGFAEDGSTIVSESGNSTTITGTFSANGWDATANGTGVSDFGTAFITAPVTATWDFSNPVEDLSFTLEHVSSQGTTYDDEFTLYIYDENGVLIPAANIIAALTGVINATVYEAADGSVVVEADNDVAENITFDLSGFQVSQVNIIFDVGPDGTETGGAGISDFSFTVPPEPDFIVEGTAGNDTIDGTYLGDPEGDLVDSNDHSDGSNNDSILAGAGDDVVLAGEGDDTVMGADGADTIFGGAGNDALDGDDAFATGGADSIDGGAGNDTLIGDVGNDTLIGGTGDDLIFSGADNDIVSGGAGADSMFGEGGDDFLDGGADNDTLRGNDGADYLDGGSGNDSLEGGLGDDTMQGGIGDDTLVGDDGNDVIYGDTDPTLAGGANPETSAYYVTGFGDLYTYDATTGTSTLVQSGLQAYGDIAVSSDGTIFGITFQQTPEGIYEIDPVTGAETLVHSLPEAGTYATLTAGPDNALYYSDNVTGDLFRLEEDGANGYTTTSVGTLPVSSYDIVFTDTDTAFVLSNGNVLQYDVSPTGVFSNQTDLGTVNGQSDVYGLFIDGNGTVYAVEGTGEVLSTDPTSLPLTWTPETAVSGPGIYGAASVYDTGTYDVGSGADSIEAGAGNDTVYGGAGNDTINAGDGEDTVQAGLGDDLVSGGAGNDLLDGEIGDDTLAGGIGADTIDGAEGDDVIVLEDGFGNDSIDGGQTTETTGDTLDLSATTTGVTVDLTDANPENGTVNDGTDTATFIDIENIILGGGRDTVVLADGSGADTVQAFDLTDSGDGTTNDQLDVSGLTRDGGTTPVTTNDVVVTDTNGDGTGDAVLTFTGGESITLVGVLASEVESVNALVAIGIPDGRDYIVEGTTGADLIDLAYTGDPEGDLVDASDNLAGGSSDSIEAGAGDDTVFSGIGSDTILGGDGNDVINGESGNDLLYGGADNDVLDGGRNDDSVYGEAGDDTILSNMSSGADFYDGGTGTDTFLIGGTVTDGFGYTIDLTTGVGSYDNTYLNFENVIGGSEADSFTGTSGNNILTGNAGNDTLDGGDGDDTLSGGDDADSIVGGSGNDSIDGGSGDDTVVADLGSDSIFGGSGNDSIDGGDGNDFISGGFISGGMVTPTILNGDFSAGAANWTGGAQGIEVGQESIYLGNGSTNLVAEINVSPAETTTLEQDFVVSEAGTATLSFDGALRTSGELGLDGYTVEVLDSSGTVVGSMTVIPTAIGTWETYTLDINFPDADTYTLRFTEVGGSDGSGALLDNVEFLSTADNDTLNGDGGDDTIYGNAGDDLIYAGEGTDVAFGGEGDDYLSGGGGNDSLVGGAGNDNFNGGEGSDTIEGGADNDNINGDAGADSLSGGTGNDSIWGGDGDDTILGGAGNDALYANAGNDSVDAGSGSDFIALDSGNDTVFAGDDADNIQILAGSYLDGAVVTVDGGTGGVDTDNLTLTTWTAFRNLTQTLDADADSTSGSVELLDASGNWITVNFTEIEALNLPATDLTPDFLVEGTAGADLIDAAYVGDPEGDLVDNNDHSDGSNIDNIEAGDGNDTVLAGAGNDTVRGELGDDSILGDAGNDTLYGDAGADTIQGGIGDDLIFAGTGDDSVLGEDGADRINDGTGNDYVDGGAGADTFFTQDGYGVDTIVGGEAGDDNDEIVSFITNNSTLDLTAGGTGADAESGTLVTGADSISFTEIEAITLGAGSDSVIGSTAGDRVDAGAGDDTLDGNGGDDTLVAGIGADTVDGGAGNDQIDLGGDTDRDVVVLTDGGGSDSITNFDLTDSGDGSAVDQVDVSGLTGGTGEAVGIWDVVVTDTNGDGTGDAILTFPNGESITLVGVTPDQVDSASELSSIGIPCFTPGTMITTENGNRPVETLSRGDKVLTVDNGFKPISWVGKRTLDQNDLIAHPNLRPIIIRKGAFGNSRKMRVSPQHGMIHGQRGEERLIRAKHVVEEFGGKFARVDQDCQDVTYIHIMFDEHELVFAEGAKTESFYPGPMALRTLDAQAAFELLHLFPELALVAHGHALTEEAYCLPARHYMNRKEVRATLEITSAAA